MTPDARDFVDMQLSRETRIAYEKDLTRWFDFSTGQEPNAVPYGLVVAFRNHLSGRYSPSTASRTFSTTRTYGRWRMQIEHSERNPFDAVKRPRRTKGKTPWVPTDEDVDTLMNAARPRPHRRAVIALLLNGLRASEAAGLRKDDITYDDANGGFVMRVLGKGDKERLVPAQTEVMEALRDFWSSTDVVKEGPWAVHDPMGNRYSGPAINMTVRNTAALVRMPKMHAHALRHHYGTRLSRAGVPIERIRDLMGHESIATTSIYIQMNMAELFKAARMDPREQKKELRAVS